MRRFFCALLCAVCLFAAPCPALAMEADFSLRFGKEEECWVGELWYDQTLLWQLAYLPSGALPVSTLPAKYRTVIAPDFQGGFFLFRMN